VVPPVGPFLLVRGETTSWCPRFVRVLTCTTGTEEAEIVHGGPGVPDEVCVIGANAAVVITCTAKGATTVTMDADVDDEACEVICTWNRQVSDDGTSIGT